jgi:two-component system, cell cycle response regulator DivK
VTRIAVVEDNPDNRLLLQALLSDRYDLVEYDNGMDALAGMGASPPDLVLLDISLPGMDGNEILGRIRTDPRLRPLPVIALTAHAMAGDREKYLRAGFDDYITKPIVDEMLLLSAIERWIEPRSE